MIPFALQLHITGRCNLRCLHCYIAQHSAELSVEEIRAVLDQYEALCRQLQDRTGQRIVPHLHVTGGEPLLHRQIGDVLSLLQQKREIFRIAIMSNGSLVDDAVIPALQKLELKGFQLSLDGDEATHNAIRGPGDYRRVLQAMDRLAAAGIPVRVSFTANAANFRQFPQVAEVCRAHGVSSLWSDRYVPVPGGTLQPLSRDDVSEYLQLLQTEHLRQENLLCGLSVENFRALQFLTGNRAPYVCMAGEQLMAVDEYGRIYPCRRLPLPCGDIRTGDLSQVYFNSPVFQSLRRHESAQQCTDCAHRNTCRGGARCISYAVTGSCSAADPDCPLQSPET